MDVHVATVSKLDNSFCGTYNASLRKKPRQYSVSLAQYSTIMLYVLVRILS